MQVSGGIGDERSVSLSPARYRLVSLGATSTRPRNLGVRPGHRPCQSRLRCDAGRLRPGSRCTRRSHGGTASGRAIHRCPLGPPLLEQGVTLAVDEHGQTPVRLVVAERRQICVRGRRSWRGVNHVNGTPIAVPLPRITVGNSTNTGHRRRMDQLASVPEFRDQDVATVDQPDGGLGRRGRRRRVQSRSNGPAYWKRPARPSYWLRVRTWKLLPHAETGAAIPTGCAGTKPNRR